MWFVPLFALFGGMMGAFSFWRFEAPVVAKWIWFFTAAVILLYCLASPLRKWFYMAWLGAVFPIGWIVSHLLLAIVFYMVVFPVGMLMRLFRYDALKRKFDPDCESYWRKREKNNDPRKYFRQF